MASGSDELNACDDRDNVSRMTSENSEMTSSMEELNQVRDNQEVDMSSVVSQQHSTTETISNNKRNREISQDEGWTTVNGRVRKYARRSEIHDTIRMTEDRIEVCVSSTSVLPKQFKLAKILKSENIGDITRIKYANPHKVLIIFSNEDSCERLINSQYFKNEGYKCQRTLETIQSYGVVKYIDLDLSEEEIVEGLESDIQIIGVKRLKRRSSLDSRWEPSEAVRICFMGSSLPSYIHIFNTRAEVTPYKYPVTQCARCWRFGHVMKLCPSNKVICPKCSRNHPNCDTVEYKCNNCSGNHMTLAKTCPVYIKEKKIRDLMAEFNCTYKRALTMYVPPEHPITEPASRGESQYIVREEIQMTSEHNTVTSLAISSESKNTYADTVKSNQGSKNPKKKKKSKERRGTPLPPLPNHSPEDIEKESSQESKSDVESINSEDNYRRNRSKSKRSNFGGIWSQLKEKILDTESTWENKLKSGACILFEWIKSIIMKYILEVPILINFKQWINELTDHQ